MQAYRLDDATRSVLEHRMPGLSDYQHAVLLAGDDAEAVAATARMVALAAETGARYERLIEDLVPPVKVPGPAVVLQARRNAEARAGLLAEGAYTGEQLAELFGSRARNRHQLASGWKKEGRIFGVDHGGLTYYPSFQFDEGGRPRQVIADVLPVLLERLSRPWEVALWFVGANGWLDGQRPVDLLTAEPERVVEAAAAGAQARVF